MSTMLKEIEQKGGGGGREESERVRERNVREVQEQIRLPVISYHVHVTPSPQSQLQ